MGIRAAVRGALNARTTQGAEDGESGLGQCSGGSIVEHPESVAVGRGAARHRGPGHPGERRRASRAPARAGDGRLRRPHRGEARIESRMVDTSLPTP